MAADAHSAHAAPAVKLAEVRRRRGQFLVHEILVQSLEAMPAFAVVLDEHRQIIGANSEFLDRFGIVDIETIIGMRPGEAIGCLHHLSGPGGCGTAPHCATCGAKAALAEGATGGPAVAPVRLTVEAELEAADLEVKVTTLELHGLPVSICAFTDVSAQKRKEILERIFFHDVLNTAGGIRGLASVLLAKGITPDEEEEFKRWIVAMSDKLIDEIQHQRHLLAAERGEFTPSLRQVCARDILLDIFALYVKHDVAEGRNLSISDDIPDLRLQTDEAVVRRILGNLVKNALEATPAGGTVTLGLHDRQRSIDFSVHNPGMIPREVQLQLFERSFSTKAPTGRGIGTYSVKLFTEKFLKGRVWFESNEEMGTTFTVSLPRT